MQNSLRWCVFTALCTVLFFVQPCKAQTTKQDLVEAFLRDVVNINITGEALMKKHMCPANKETQQALDVELYRLRMKMLGQSKKVTNHLSEYLKSYNELSEKEQDLLINKADEGNTFSFKGEQGIAFLVLVKDEKIASFTTVKKGDARVFINYCN